MEPEEDYSNVDWEEQEQEIEALEVIFPDEFEVQQIKPYKFTIVINSNAEPEDNHLKMLLQVEWPVDYPQSVPFCLLKNMSPQYLDNKMLDDYEQEIRKKAHESIGMQMMFDICEILRERIADLNDAVVDKYKGILQA